MSNVEQRKLTNVGFWETTGELFHDLGVVPAQQMLEGLHSSIGLPWWGCIVGGAVGIRLVVLPLRLYGLQQSLLLGRAKSDIVPQIPHLRATHRESGKFNRAVANALLEAVKARKTHPFRVFTPLLAHLPLIVAMGGALRKMSAFPVFGLAATGLAVPGWDVGGVFGGNLGVADGWMTAMVVASNVATIEWIFRQGAAKKEQTPPHRRGLYWIMHGVNAVGAWVLSWLPVAINFFVLVNNGLAILEGSLLRSRWIASIVAKRIKPVPNAIYRETTN